MVQKLQHTEVGLWQNVEKLEQPTGEIKVKRKDRQE
jgi:hypothetical protein